MPSDCEDELSGLDVADAKGVWLVEALEESAGTAIELESGNGSRCRMARGVDGVVAGVCVCVTAASECIQCQ